MLTWSRKNRRDGATVSTRVLAMSDVIGQRLFDSAVSSNAAGAVDVSARKMRRKDISTSSRL